VKPDTAGSNGIDAESFLVWVGRLQQEDVLFGVAKKRRDKLRKLAKNAGLEMQILDRAVKDADKDPDIVLRSLSTYRQYSEWLEAPGQQISLFEIPNSALLSHAEREEKARRTGYTLGLLGKFIDDQAYPADNEHHQAHLDGWHSGQKILLDRIQPINIAMDSEGKDDPAPAKEPDDDTESQE
jgi:hypothetical protein